MPNRPCPGSHRLVAMARGLRGNDPGGYGLPRSNRHTERLAAASRYVITEPPNPGPMTTVSKCSARLSAVVMTGIPPSPNGVERTKRNSARQRTLLYSPNLVTYIGLYFLGGFCRWRLERHRPR